MKKGMFVKLIIFLISIELSVAQIETYCPDTETYYDLESALKEPENVIRLDISMQKLTSIPASIAQLKNLECLDISFNLFGDLPPEITQLTKLRYINMTGTRRIGGVPKIVAKIPNLTVLDISDHPEWLKVKFDEAEKMLPHVKVIY